MLLLLLMLASIYAVAAADASLGSMLMLASIYAVAAAAAGLYNMLLLLPLASMLLLQMLVMLKMMKTRQIAESC